MTKPHQPTDGPDAGAVPASQRIRARIEAAGRRFHANDNIADFIEPGDLAELQREIEGKLSGVLESLVIDTRSDHNTQETAKRVAKMYVHEIFRGRYVPAPPVTEFPNVERLNELLIVGPITVRSACSHHLCPIIGRLWIGVLPNEHSNLIGLSKYVRLADWVMSRPQIQEEAVTQLADLLSGTMKPDGLALVMEADHFCMHWRGVKDAESKMINSVMRGSFLKDANLRRSRWSRAAAPDRAPRPRSGGSMLVRLLYASRAAQAVTQATIDSIMQQSREHNPAHGITGILCYGGDVYMQVLEGGRIPVNALYNRIVADARHEQVVLLHYEEVAERRFAGWTMGQVNLAKVNPSTLLKYLEKPELDPFVVSGKASMALLEELIATAQIVCRAG